MERRADGAIADTARYICRLTCNGLPRPNSMFSIISRRTRDYSERIGEELEEGAHRHVYNKALRQQETSESQNLETGVSQAGRSTFLVNGSIRGYPPIVVFLISVSRQTCREKKRGCGEWATYAEEADRTIGLPATRHCGVGPNFSYS